MAHAVRVHQRVVENQRVRLFGRKLFGHRKAQAKKKLLFGALREVLVGYERIGRRAHAADLQVLVEEYGSGGLAGDFSELYGFFEWESSCASVGRQ